MDMTGIVNSNKQAGACDAEASEPTQWQIDEVYRRARVFSAAMAPVVIATSQRPADAKWYCLAVVSGREFELERKFTHEGLQVLVPRERWSAIRRGKKIEGERPYFRGYVLIRMVGIGVSFRAFLDLPPDDGVLGFLGKGEEYHCVPERELAFFRGRGDKTNIERMPVDRSIGQASRVTVTQGPFAGKTCVVLAVTSSRSPSARLWVEEYDREIESHPVAFLQKL